MCYSIPTMKTYEGRIEINPHILLGKPVIKGTRIPVYAVVNLLAQGKSVAYILDEYPDLTQEDVQAALAFAASQINFTEMPIPSHA